MQAEKVAEVAEIKERFTRMSSAVFVDYSGLTVAEVSTLRNSCRDKGVEYKVVKNTLLRIALKEESYAEGLGDTLRGMTAVAWSYEEPSSAARILKAFAKDNEKLTIKGGILDGEMLDAKAVTNQLATLPSKDEARAMLLATLMAPAQQFVMLLNTPASSFVRLLNAKKDA